MEQVFLADIVAKSFAQHVAQIAESKGWQNPLFALNTVKTPPSETVGKPLVNVLEGTNTLAKTVHPTIVIARSEFGTHQLKLKKLKPALERPMDQFARVWDERVVALEPWREALGNYYRLTICLQTLAAVQHPNARAAATLPVFIPRGALALALGFSGAMLDQLLGGYYGSSRYYQVKGINQPGRTRKPNLAREQARAAAIAGNAEFTLFKRFVGWHAWTTPVPTKRTKHLNGKPFTNNKHIQTPDGFMRLNAGTVFVVRCTPREAGFEVNVTSEYLNHPWRDLASDMKHGKTVRALTKKPIEIENFISIVPDKLKLTRGRSKASQIPKEQELSVLNKIYYSSLTRFSNLKTRVENTDALETATVLIFDVQEALETPIPRTHALRTAWTDRVAVMLEQLLGDQTRGKGNHRGWLSWWRKAAWVVCKFAAHGLEAEAQHARDTLWLAAHEVLVRSSDNALIESRGALMISTLRANGWAELEELASGLRAG